MFCLPPTTACVAFMMLTNGSTADSALLKEMRPHTNVNMAKQKRSDAGVFLGLSEHKTANIIHTASDAVLVYILPFW